MATSQPGALLRRMFEAALAAADPAESVPRFLPGPPAGRTLVVGAGKAAAAMARAVEDHWPVSDGRPLKGLVVTRYGHAVPCRHIEVVEAAHPVPDQAGLDAAARILETVEGLGPTTCCFASSQAVAPHFYRCRRPASPWRRSRR